MKININLEEINSIKEVYGSGVGKKSIVFYPLLQSISYLIALLQMIATLGVGLYFTFGLHNYFWGILLTGLGLFNGYLGLIAWSVMSIIIGIYTGNYGLFLFEITALIVSVTSIYLIPLCLFYLSEHETGKEKNGRPFKEHQRKILVIEDEEFLRELYVEVLKEAGYEVDSTTDGEEGLKMIVGKYYDLILLELLTPKLDALTLLKLFKEKDIKKGKVAVLSIINQNSIITAVINAGADLYIVKNQLTVDQIIKELQELLSPQIESLNKNSS